MNAWAFGGESSIIGAGGNGLLSYVYGDNPAMWYINGAEQMRLTSTGLGIGTSSPYSRLTVIPSADASSPFEANQITVGEASGNAAFRLQLGYFLAPGFVWSGSVQAIRSNVPTPLILNGGGGAVGIGTSSPSKPLTVISAGAYQLRLASSEGAYSDAGIFMGSDSDDPYYHGSVKWQQADQTFRISSQHGASSGGMVFETGSHTGSPIERLRIDYAGNIGIGTSSPTAKLELSAGANSNGALKISATSTSIANFASMNFATPARIWSLGTEAGSGRFFLYNGTAGYDQLGFGGGPNSDAILTALGSGSLVFTTGDTTRMLIDSAGNVGIGTSSPSSKITVAHSADGNVAFSSVDAWSDDFQTSRAGFGINARLSRTSYSQDAVQLDATKSGWLIHGRNASNAEQVYDWLSVSWVSASGVSSKLLNLDASGNLLLGGSAAAYATPGRTCFEVTGTSSAMVTLRAGSGSSSGYLFGGADVVALEAEPGRQIVINTIGAHPISLRTNQIERVHISSDGNLLVGQTSGAGKLCITQSGAAQDNVVCTLGSGGAALSVAGTVAAVTSLYIQTSSGYAGSISSSGLTTTYNTSSDYRLKNITGPITKSGEYIDSLNPVEGSWKADGSTFVGLIAHEVQEVSRTQVATGTKDGEQMQAMDYSASELIANMIAELKSLRARVAALENN